jgi:hypothetical protein
MELIDKTELKTEQLPESEKSDYVAVLVNEVNRLISKMCSTTYLIVFLFFIRLRTTMSI